MSFPIICPKPSLRGSATAMTTLSLTLVIMALFAVTPAAADAFGTLLGNWRGTGALHLEDGQQEAITCEAGYKEKDQGKKVTMTLKCDSPRYKVNLRSRLKHDQGALSGGWFEKIREVSGSGKGRIDDQSISLHLNAIGFAADLKIARGDCSQSVELIPESGEVQRVTVEMKKGGC